MPDVVVWFCFAVLFSFGCGLITGFSLRRTRELLDDLRHEFSEHVAAENSFEPQVVDSSPGHLEQKRAERERRGEEPDDTESQIVSTRTFAQRKAEVDARKEARLDKWMPGVKDNE